MLKDTVRKPSASVVKHGPLANRREEQQQRLKGRLQTRRHGPAKASRPLFVGSGYQFVKRTLAQLAKGREVDVDKRAYVDRFFANGLLMVTHYAWGAQAPGVGTFAHLVSHNPPLKKQLQTLMPFNRSDIPGRIAANWPARVAGLFNDIAGTPQQQNKLKQIAGRRMRRGESYQAIARYLGMEDRDGLRVVWSRLMMGRFELSDVLIPKPDLSPENAGKLLRTWRRSKQPSTDLRDEFGVPYFHLRFQSGPPPEEAMRVI